MDFKYISNDIRESIIETAHAVHRNPELSHKEFKTTELLKNELIKIGIEIPDEQPETGVVGLLRGSLPGPTLAMRADIDALPIVENSKHEICSGNSGVMHACGHDFHTASLLGAVMALAKRKDSLPGNVLFVFQPGEEHGTGAKEVVASGIFEKYPPKAFFSLHVKPDIPAGKIGIRKGPIMAALCCFSIDIHGKGGHGATPHLAVDPIVAATGTVDALQCIRSRWMNPAEPFTLSVCSIHGGTAYNVIPDDVHIEGTFRYALPSYRESVKEQIVEISKSVAAAHGCTAECRFFHESPPLVNDGDLAKIATEAAAELFGEESVIEQNFWMASEDFSLYREIAPIFMYHIGVGEEDGSSAGLHTPNLFVPDETAPFCAELLTGTVLKALEKENR